MTDETIAWRGSLEAAREEARAGPPAGEPDGERLLLVDLFDPG
jgi:hypothetical protein